MEFLPNGFTLSLCQGAFPLSTDSMALADFVKLPRGACVLDLGSGCGTLGLLLCACHEDCQVTGVELDSAAHAAALENARANGITHRFSSICADLRTIPSLLKPGAFQVCISNPPYFTGGPESSKTPLARRTATCSMEELMSAAGWALKFGGDLFVVHKPERLAELCACAVKNKLEPKNLRLLRHRPDGPVSLILVHCRKGAKPGLLWQEAVLHEADGSPTDYYKKIYHL